MRKLTKYAGAVEAVAQWIDNIMRLLTIREQEIGLFDNIFRTDSE